MDSHASWSRRWVALVVAIALAALAVPAAAGPPDDPDTEAARRHFRAGSRLYDEGRYGDAVQEFEAARALKPLPAFDFNIARSLDRLERWGDAADAYERYLRAQPNAPDADELRARITQLRARVPRAAAAARPAARPLRTAAIVVGAFAVAAAAAGTGAYLSVYSDYQQKRSACIAAPCTTAELGDLRARVEVAQISGGVLFALAAAAAVADVALWIADGRRAHRERAWVAPSVGGLVVGGRF